VIGWARAGLPETKVRLGIAAAQVGLDAVDLGQFKETTTGSGCHDLADQFKRIAPWPRVEGLSPRCDRVLSGPDEHQDDYRRRATGRHRCRRAAGHSAVSVVGMNVIVNDAKPVALVVLISVTVVIWAMLLVWANRKGWW
jgi:hypothetical protein